MICRTTLIPVTEADETLTVDQKLKKQVNINLTGSPFHDVSNLISQLNFFPKIRSNNVTVKLQCLTQLLSGVTLKNCVQELSPVFLKLGDSPLFWRTLMRIDEVSVRNGH